MWLNRSFPNCSLWSTDISGCSTKLPQPESQIQPAPDLGGVPGIYKPGCFAPHIAHVEVICGLVIALQDIQQ